MGWTTRQSSTPRYRRGWGGPGRSEVIRRMVVTIDQYDELLPLVHGAAAAVADLMAAATVHVTLIVDDQFLDLVNVGEIAPGMVTFPESQSYPLESYPWAAHALLSHRGYLSSDDTEVVREYTSQSPHDVPASFLGAPIVSQGRVFGELFITRGPGQPPLTSEDLDLAIDLATVLGGRIPHVLS